MQINQLFGQSDNEYEKMRVGKCSFEKHNKHFSDEEFYFCLAKSHLGNDASYLIERTLLLACTIT
jgi:hypothetical protein